ncbi:MAG: class I SAM-dependent methyltransferase, partial [Proteobacteria bacterium]|nr:class I SAM-dependent methyltransferase [Pseudomonadota bacterium]
SLSCGQNHTRDSWQRPQAIMDSIGVREGLTIGEAGAGTGYFTFHLAARVGSSGKVFANDIDRGVLEDIDERRERESLTNIETIVGEVDDPLFPKGRLDMVVMMNAFHDFTEPTTWMRNVIPSMKPSATLVIIDRDPDKMQSSWNHFMTKNQILEAMSATDFTIVRILTFLERDNVYVFRLADSP